MILDVRDVGVHFGGLVAVRGAAFEACRGQVRAIIGPNGAGKTTLFNAIAGNVPVSAGTVRFKGKDITHLTPYRRSVMGLRRTFQQGGLFGSMTAIENVLVGLHSEDTRACSLIGLLTNSRRARMTERKAVSRARDMLASAGMSQYCDMQVSALSGGVQRAIEIVRALASGADLLLLDEPAVGLTPNARRDLGLSIRRVAREQHIAVLLIEHSVELVMSTADIVMVFVSGECIAEGAPDDIRNDAKVVEAYLGY